MFMLTKASVLKCMHGGLVRNDNSQSWVRIGGDPLLVEPDSLGRAIAGCPMATITTPPCTMTVQVADNSYSAFIKIDGHRVSLDSTNGRTNWSQLGITPFSVATVAQRFVQSEA